MWEAYFRDAYPTYEDLTWPGRVPFLALTSGTTQGTTKYIPVTAEMVASNRRAAQTMIAFHLRGTPDSQLFAGRMFFLGGSTALEQPAPTVRQGDLSGIAAVALSPLLLAYTFPPLELALDSNWDRKLAGLALESVSERITLVGGVPSWLLLLFERVLEKSGKSTVAEVWPSLELVVHGGVKFDPYRDAFRSILGSPEIRLQETYPCSEGFIAFGDRETGLLRLVFDHGLFYEFVPLEEARSTSAGSSLAGDRPEGGKLRHRRFHVRRHVGARHRRYGSVRVARPAALLLHGPDQVHAFRVRRASDQRRGGGGDHAGRDRDRGFCARLARGAGLCGNAGASSIHSGVPPATGPA